MPRVSVVMSVLNGEKYLSEAIESILNQTFNDFEFVIVNEFGSSLKATTIIEKYAKSDTRIKIINNTTRLGLPKSLNVGIDASIGEYIARMDADDASMPSRFEKQIAYLDENPDIFMCGTLQRTISPKGLSYEEVPCEPEELRASLPFGCEITHTSIMFRRKQFIANGWWYTDQYSTEDYHIWAKIHTKVKIANIPEVLVTHRWGFEQRSTALAYKAHVDICEISRLAFLELGVEFKKYNLSMILGGFRSLPWQYRDTDTTELLNQNYQFLCEIEKLNSIKKLYEPNALSKVLSRRWNKWVVPVAGEAAESYPAPHFALPQDFEPSKELISKPSGLNNKLTKRGFLFLLKAFLKRMFRIFYKPYFDKILSIVEQSTKNQLQPIITKLDELTVRLNETSNDNYVPYVHGERIRIVFIYQMASFWPSWDTLIESLLSNNDVDVRIVLFDVKMREESQIKGAEDFLRQVGVKYINFADFNFPEFNPLIVVYQTPYDHLHRPGYLYALNLKRKGHRIAYVTYGIEISSTPEAETGHFKLSLVQNAWRIYTFSETMRKDYMRFISPSVVKSFGHPKFDRLHDVDSVVIDDRVLEKANGRKIILWKMHFPMVREIDGKFAQVTPDISEYSQFSKKICTFPDVFFLVMLHPKFMEQALRQTHIPKIGEMAYNILLNINEAENAMLFDEPDYRPALVCSDAFILDRSALMVEAGVLSKPILYMSSKHRFEPLSNAVEAICLSYYQGTVVQEIIDFVEMIRKGHDPKMTERENAIRDNIPFFDGKSGSRIAQDLIDGVKTEGGVSHD